MPSDPSPSSPGPRSTADYIADRETLQGAPRQTFLRLLREVFGFAPISLTRRGAAVLETLAWLPAALGALIESLQGARLGAILLWLAFTSVGAILAWETARRLRRMRLVGNEFEWRAYCLVIRPRILLHYPGLLDRNLVADGTNLEDLPSDRSSALRALLLQGGASLWVSARVGWALGSSVALAWRIGGEFDTWMFCLPIAAALLVPPAWTLFRLNIFRRLQHAPLSDR